MEMTFIETHLSIQGEECTVRMHQGDRQGPKVTLVSGSYLEITPYPGVWIAGKYCYDKSSREHYWRPLHDPSRFVGLLDGMSVRVLPLIMKPAESLLEGG